MQGAATVALQNRSHRIELDRNNGRLLSIRAAVAPQQEFIEPGDPRVFVIQYLDQNKEYRQIPSTAARSISVSEPSPGNWRVQFRGLCELDLDAEVTVRTASGDDATHLSVAVHNRSGILITDVQFPFLIVRYNLGGQPGGEALLQPFSVGRLHRAPQPPGPMPR